MQIVKFFFRYAWVLAAFSAIAAPSLPSRDLTIELRQIDESKAQGADGGAASAGKTYSAGAASIPEWEPQMVQVRNGEKATLKMQSVTPMQWVQSAFVQVDKSGSATSPVPAAAANKTANGWNGAAAVQNALSWFDAGESITVHPKWIGGKTAVVELEVQKAGFDERNGADLPTQSRKTLSTTVTAPLAQWLTIAATGKNPQATTYNSESLQQTRRLLQIRVMVP